MSHHDAVAASNNWSEDPFGGEIKDGRIWGRGSASSVHIT
ncbi:MAG: M20/M25/M40 family metallo-hydrolase [Solobacterium sp.]|nr:M20/M25/M40 family metallo-hydrolase [Solobacterium sp.]